MTHIHSDKPRIVEFIRDFGDALGGVMLGNGIAIANILLSIIGLIIIGISIYLRFYSKKEEKEVMISEKQLTYEGELYIRLDSGKNVSWLSWNYKEIESLLEQELEIEYQKSINK